MTPKKVLCVCLGNICRSPTAEAVLRQVCQQQYVELIVDSAGTAAYHIGDAPDPRSQQYAKARGYDLSSLRARQLQLQDFVDFDFILAMDLQNFKDIQNMQQHAIKAFGSTCKAELAMMSAHDASRANQSIADPYYGKEADFQRVIDQCETASHAWAKTMLTLQNKGHRSD